MHVWLLLAYKVPRDPTANRVYVWRKLKRLGAILLHDSIWVLPATPQTKEQLQWLSTEIVELGGEFSLWESRLVLDGQQDEALVQRFQAAAEASYQEILAELKRKKPDLAGLSKRFQQAQAQDYFHCELGKRVREALLAAKGEPKP